MRDAEVSARSTLSIEADLAGKNLAAVVYRSSRDIPSVLRLNRAILSGQDCDRVLSWARHEIARGVRVSWLLADELADLR